MMVRLQPYPAYEPSGVEWLGDVPAHWEVRKLRNVLSQRTERNRPDWPLLSVVRERGVILRNIENTDENHNFVPDDLSNYKVVHKGQFAMNKMKAWQGSYGISKHDGIVSPAYFTFALTGMREGYFHAAIRSRAYVPFFTQASDGVRIGQWDLSLTRMREIPFLAPPLAEQAAIVRYLDHADRRIRRYISAKQKLIALLQEEKQAIISQAVTRGLDPNVPLKPSGVEWLGDVPQYWEVRRLGFLATKFGSGVTPRGGATVYQEDGVPLLRSQNIHFDGLQIQKVARIAPKLHQELSGTHVRPGDVLLNITGASIGRVCSVPEGFTEGNVNQHVCIIRPIHDHLLPNLLAAYLSTPAMQHAIKIEQSGASREGLTLHSIRNFKVVVPSLAEQAAIVEHLDKATAGIDAAIGRARRQIELLREYRTRLIADVVTGKLDVRAAAAQLPEQPDDQEPVDESDPTEDMDGALEEAVQLPEEPDELGQTT